MASFQYKEPKQGLTEYKETSSPNKRVRQKLGIIGVSTDGRKSYILRLTNYRKLVFGIQKG